MERGQKVLIYLDTHIVLWLYEGILDKFPTKAKKRLETDSLITARRARAAVFI